MDKKDRSFQIAILLYQGSTALDAVGPWEVLSRIPNTEVRFVGKEEGPERTEGGALLLGVRHTVAQTPSPDLVLVLGGTTTPGER
jgi:putative intracellular protease/amidase